MSKIKKSDDGLFIPSRQLSGVVVTLFSFGIVLFFAGYFFGKHHLVEPFVAKAQSESFADQIYASIYALRDIEQQEITLLGDSEPNALALNEEPSDLPPIEIQDEYEQEAESDKWYAQLIGYGQETTARQFAQKLEKKGFAVSVVARTSTTAKGAKRTWYQVVTPPYDDKGQLQQVVDKIAHDEKLKGVQISTC